MFFIFHSCRFLCFVQGLICIYGSNSSLYCNKRIFRISTSLQLLEYCCPVFHSFPNLLDLHISCLQLHQQVGDFHHLLQNVLQLCFDDALLLQRCGWHVDQGIICLFNMILHNYVCAMKSTFYCGGFLVTPYFLLCLYEVDLKFCPYFLSTCFVIPIITVFI